MKLGPRLHLSPTRLRVFDPSKVEQQKVGHKPKGLWYACGDEWVRWTKQERPEWWEEYRYAYEVDVNPKEMLVIRTVKQLDAFNKKYGEREVYDPDARGRADDDLAGLREGRGRLAPDIFEWIDWTRVTREYGGIEICPFQDLRRTMWTWYHDWDVASGCVWSSAAIRGITEVVLP